MTYTAKEIGAAKRELVLDLLESRKMLALKQDPYVLISSAQMRAIRLSVAGIDWRSHRVRSKTYKGLLGVLFDEFKSFHNGSYLEV